MEPTSKGSQSDRPVIGVDLGTTNSCVSFVDTRGDIQRVPVATGNNPPYDAVLASMVFDPLGEAPKIGLEAEGERLNDPEATFLSYFKPLLDDQSVRVRRPFAREVKTREYDFVNESDLYTTVVEWREVGGEFSRQELIGGAALLFERLLQQAIAAGAPTESDLWLGTPVTFSSCARKRILCALQKTRQASGEPFFADYRELLRRVHFVLEPIAVTPSSDLEVDETANILIFDHGGGTLDLSLIGYGNDNGLPVPLRELAAGGSASVAGRDFDAAFLDALLTHEEYGLALRDIPSIDQQQIAEATKRELSTSTTTRLRPTDLSVDREFFLTATRPLLDGIATELDRLVERANLRLSDVDWVVMTGGSSLIPAVQDTVMAAIPHAASNDRVLRYFPDDTGPGGGVELAITDVARGLAEFGQGTSLQRILPWDIEYAESGRDRFQTVFPRGTEYIVGANGQPALKATLPLDPTPEGVAVGLYENQLDHRFLFGIADSPPVPPNARLEIELRPNALFPTLAIRDPNGTVLARDESLTGFEADARSEACLDKLPPGHLEEFFDQDAEYLPVAGFVRFRHSPLTRRLRVGDQVEWTASRRDSSGEWQFDRGRGEITGIEKAGNPGAGLPEMDSWTVGSFVFEVEGKPRLRFSAGYVRLSPRPGMDY